MCYYCKIFKIKFSSKSSTCYFYFHVIFVPGHENYQSLSPPIQISLLTSGLHVSLQAMHVLPLAKITRKGGLGLEWLDKAPLV